MLMVCIQDLVTHYCHVCTTGGWVQLSTGRLQPGAMDTDCIHVLGVSIRPSVLEQQTNAQAHFGGGAYAVPVPGTIIPVVSVGGLQLTGRVLALACGTFLVQYLSPCLCYGTRREWVALNEGRHTGLLTRE
jgi:hypothetical protein